ncbi:MAG: hypothetical protein IJ489_00735 [Clostridia bacterium]|nr:hypothetical protein [Clostridia bacterium]
MKSISFDYAFAPPHALTLCRPSASEKVIADMTEQCIKFAWTDHSQKYDYPLAWTPHPMDITLCMNVSVGGAVAEFQKWYRHESGAPYLFAEGKSDGVEFSVQAIAAKTGVIVKTEIGNHEETMHDVHIQFAHTNGWVISNKGWIDGIHKNLLMTMNNGRADRILTLAFGAEDYPLYGRGEEEFDHQPPMNDLKLGIAAHSMKKITSYYRMNCGEQKTGYFLIPYKKYFDELEALKALDLEKEITEALDEWVHLLDRGARFEIADEKLLHCYRSAIADLFVMREQIGEYTGIVSGTRFYRSSSACEPLASDILLDTLGYTEEALADYRMHFEGQDPDGCWVFSKGWEHEVWGLDYNKTNAVLEHYYMTRDRDFLETWYPRMLASALFNCKARATTKNSPKKSERGLMPRGMGDCGMMNGGDYYGVFYPHNAMSVGSDFKVLEAARILGKTEDIAVLEALCEDAKNDLLTSVRENLRSVEGGLMMPAVAGAPISSIYGCMYPFFPAKLVSADEPMIQGAVKYIESKQQSEGGLPLGTGWMKDGLWIAMALGMIARSYLRLGLYKEARKYLYPALNHASPFVTYCEERGGEKGTTKKSGDLQHLWTPLSIGQYMTDAFWFEDDVIHVFAGILPEWLIEGKKIGLYGFRTHYGKTDISITCDDGTYSFELKTERPMEKKMILHLPLDENDIKDIEIDVIDKTEISERFSI